PADDQHVDADGRHDLVLAGIDVARNHDDAYEWRLAAQLIDRWALNRQQVGSAFAKKVFREFFGVDVPGQHDGVESRVAQTLDRNVAGTQCDDLHRIDLERLQHDHAEFPD